MPPIAPSSIPPGTFRPNGSWDGLAQAHTTCYGMVQTLIDMRRRGGSPADIARYVEASAFPDILGSARDFWRSRPCWYGLTPSGSSASATIQVTLKGCNCVDCMADARLPRELSEF